MFMFPPCSAYWALYDNLNTSIWFRKIFLSRTSFILENLSIAIFLFPHVVFCKGHHASEVWPSQVVCFPFLPAMVIKGWVETQSRPVTVLPGTLFHGHGQGLSSYEVISCQEMGLGLSSHLSQGTIWKKIFCMFESLPLDFQVIRTNKFFFKKIEANLQRLRKASSSSCHFPSAEVILALSKLLYIHTI